MKVSRETLLSLYFPVGYFLPMRDFRTLSKRCVFESLFSIWTKNNGKRGSYRLFWERMGKNPISISGEIGRNVSWDIFSMSVFAHSREKAIRIRSV